MPAITSRSAPEQLVLIVHADASVRDLLSRSFKGAHFNVVEAGSLAQARKLLSAPLLAAVIADRLPDGPASAIIPSLKVASFVIASSSQSFAAAEALVAGAREVFERDELPWALVSALRGLIQEAGRAPVAAPAAISAAAETKKATRTSELFMSVLKRERAFLRQAGHYRVLEVPPEASEADIRAAFEVFLRKWDPTNLSEHATNEMRAIALEILAMGQEAVRVLCNPQARSAYRSPPTFIPKTRKRPVAEAASPPPLVAEPVRIDQDRVASALQTLTPKSTGDIDLDRARMLLQTKPGEARLLLGKVLTAHPMSRVAQALDEVAQAIAAIDDPEQAALHVEQALNADPECAEALVVGEELAAGRQRLLAHVQGGRRLVVEAICLAFSRSDLKEIVGGDALRVLLEGRYIEMVATPGILNLEPLWETLSVQPGFKIQAAYAPFARLKMWQTKLGAEVELPKALGEVGMVWAHDWARGCPATDEDLDRAVAAAPKALLPARGGSARAPVILGTLDSPRTRRGKRAAWFLGPLAALAIAGSLSFAFGGSIVEVISSSDINVDGLSVAEARRAGPVLGVRLAETGWLRTPEKTRRQHIAELVSQARAQGISGISIMGPKGEILASVYIQGSNVAVRFMY